MDEKYGSTVSPKFPTRKQLFTRNTIKIGPMAVTA